ncbi:hypothetical protein MNEG_9421, partial [Monoraphidium neglectum]
VNGQLAKPGHKGGLITVPDPASLVVAIAGAITSALAAAAPLLATLPALPGLPALSALTL